MLAQDYINNGGIFMPRYYNDTTKMPPSLYQQGLTAFFIAITVKDRMIYHVVYKFKLT